jgi:hypothetical protein
MLRRASAARSLPYANTSASGKYAVIWGRPLCDDSQIHEVAKAFTHHLKKEKNLKPIWACIDEATEQVLLERMGWKCVVAVAEQRVDPVTLAAEGGERAVRHKANRAQKEGVTVTEKEDYLSEEEEAEIVIRLKEWQQNRHGTQIYSAGLRPFVDKEHASLPFLGSESGLMLDSAPVFCCPLQGERNLRSGRPGAAGEGARIPSQVQCAPAIGRKCRS